MAAARRRAVGAPRSPAPELGAGRAPAGRPPRDGRRRAGRRRAGAASPPWPPGRPAAPVAIVVPRLGARWPRPRARRRARARRAQPLRRRAGARPPGAGARPGGRRGADRRGRRGAWARSCSWRAGRAGRDAAEFLHLAAVASLTEVAIEEAREEVEQNLRGSFLEELRARRRPRAARRRAPGRPGWAATCRAAPSCCAPSSTTDRPRHVVATIARRAPGRAGRAHGRPRLRAAARRRRRRRARGDAGGRAPAGGAAAPPRDRRALVLLRATPPSSPRAIQEAELVLDVLRQSDAPIAEDIGTGHLPAAVPRAGLPSRGGAQLLRGHGRADRPLRRPVRRPTWSGTLEAYLEQNCNMNATAAAIYAHRHTVAYRLERVKRADRAGPDALRGPRAPRPRAEGLPHHRPAAPPLTSSSGRGRQPSSRLAFALEAPRRRSRR